MANVDKYVGPSLLWHGSLICAALVLALVDLSAQTASDSGAFPKPELIPQTSHIGAVAGVAFSPDGQVLVSVGQDTIKLWDPTGNHLLRTIDVATTMSEGRPLEARQSNILRELTAVAFSPDGKKFATTAGGGVILWNLNGLNYISPPLLEYPGFAEDLAFDPLGRWIVTPSSIGVLRIWDSADLHLIRTINAHQGPVFAVAVCPDGSRIASGGADNAVLLWDVGNGSKLHSLRGHTDLIRALSFSPDGKILASGSDDKTIRLWNTTSWTSINTLNTDGEVDGIAFSPDGKLMAAETERSYVSLWDLASGQVVGKYKMQAARFISRFFIFKQPGEQSQRIVKWSKGRLAFSPDGKLLACGGSDVVEILDMSTMKWLARLGTVSRHLRATFGLNGHYLITSDSSDIGDLKLWNLATGQRARSLTVPSSGRVNSIAVSPNGNVLASGHESGLVQTWDLSTLRKIHGHPNKERVLALAFSPDGNALALEGQDGIKIWDAASEVELRTLESESNENARTLVFRPDGRRLAATVYWKSILVWDPTTGEKIDTIDAEGTNSLAVQNRIGGALASGGTFGVKLWDGPEWKSARVLDTYPVSSLVFSPDGRLLATDPNVWDVSTNRSILRLRPNETPEAFSPNSRWLVSGKDGEAALWDTTTGELSASLLSFGRNDWLVATPDGLFDGSPDGWAKAMWRFSSGLFDVSPMEAFFSDFYSPGLLSDIIAGTQPKAPRQIALIDRRQPRITLSVIDSSPTHAFSSRTVTLGIRAESPNPDQNHPLAGRTHDLRLFRNGSLINIWHGEIDGKIQLRLTVPIVAGSNRFTAYAFNDANVKSQDAVLQVVGADNLKRKGTAYIIAVGVNNYSNPSYDLRFATPDAEAFAVELRQQQSQLGTFSNVVIVRLFDGDATKANILSVLNLLSGRIPQLPKDSAEALQSVHMAEPEDAVFIYFAGHGASARSHYYLIPRDFGYQGKRSDLDKSKLGAILDHSISDEELGQALENIDAGKMVLVIDACNSGQALEADEKRRGPMNSTGLAQLAYEKGMYILTASQDYQAALEVEQLGHGLLTYALVEEGLKTPAAEVSPSGELDVRDWLDYAAKRVPELQQTLMGQTRRLEHESEQAADSQVSAVQQPRVFYRREPDIQPLIIARNAAIRDRVE